MTEAMTETYGLDEALMLAQHDARERGPVVKDMEADEGWWYASLAAIDAHVGPALKAHGLTYFFVSDDVGVGNTHHVLTTTWRWFHRPSGEHRKVQFSLPFHWSPRDGISMDNAAKGVLAGAERHMLVRMLRLVLVDPDDATKRQRRIDEENEAVAAILGDDDVPDFTQSPTARAVAKAGAQLQRSMVKLTGAAESPLAPRNTAPATLAPPAVSFEEAYSEMCSAVIAWSDASGGKRSVVDAMEAALGELVTQPTAQECQRVTAWVQADMERGDDEPEEKGAPTPDSEAVKWDILSDAIAAYRKATATRAYPGTVLKRVVREVHGRWIDAPTRAEARKVEEYLRAGAEAA